MMQEILDEVVYLFVEQFDNLYGMLTDRTDVKRIRRSADVGEAEMYSVAVSVFGDKIDDILIGAARDAMGYIAYVDETWIPENTMDKKTTLEIATLHLESLKKILHMAQENDCNSIKEIRRILTEAEIRLQHLEEK